MTVGKYFSIKFFKYCIDFEMSLLRVENIIMMTTPYI